MKKVENVEIGCLPFDRRNQLGWALVNGMVFSHHRKSWRLPFIISLSGFSLNQNNMADRMVLMFAIDELTEEFHDDLFDDEEDVIVSASVGTFMRRNLNRIEGYVEATLPACAPSEFRSHFPMTRNSLEILCREIVPAGRIPTGNTRGRQPILLLRNRCWCLCGP